MSILKKFTGIIGDTFQLGLSGPKLKKANDTKLEVKNNADDDYGDLVVRRLQTFVWYFDDEFDSLRDLWDTRVTSGSAAIRSNGLNGILRLTTGIVDDDEESLDEGNRTFYRNDGNPIYESLVSLGQNVDIHAEVGLIDAGGTNYITFRCDTDVDSNWYLVCSNSGSETTDQGPAISVNWFAFRLEWISDTEVEWFTSTDRGVTWSLQGTISTNVPTAKLQKYIMVQVRNNAGVARIIDLDYIKTWQNRI